MSLSRSPSLPRRRSLAFTTLLLTALLGGCPGRHGETPPTAATADKATLAGAGRGWNVVVISIDTLRADRLNAYGYAKRTTSPQIDELLAGGVRFAQAQAPRALTWPSLASLLTGLYPSGHGVIENGYGLPDGLPTLPLVLGASGYQTGAFLSNMCKANHQGWQGWACSGGVDGKTTRKALEWAATVDGNRPFLLWAHYFGPHPPYYNGGDLALTTLDPGYEGPLGTKMWMLDRVMTDRLDLTPRDRQHLDAIYDAAVIGTDGHVHDLLSGLAAAGRLEKTMVVFVADHGEDLYEHHRYLYHACSVYQSSLHIPLGLRAPGLIPAGATVEQPVELVDVLPTVLDLLGVAAPAELHGTSLVPYLERPDRGGSGKPAFGEYDSTRIRNVRAGNWKLIVNPDEVVPFCFAPVPDLYPIARCELYDLATDPGETTNLCASQPGKVAELQALLDDRFRAITSRAQEQELSEEMKKELQALGYVAD